MANGFLQEFSWCTESSFFAGLFHVKLLPDSTATAGVEQQKTIDPPGSHLVLFGKSGFYESLWVFFHRKA